MRLLLHVCCGPCAAGAWPLLGPGADELAGYFVNPNIHPLVEFRRRLKAVQIFQERADTRMIYDGRYGLREYLELVWALTGCLPQNETPRSCSVRQ